MKKLILFIALWPLLAFAQDEAGTNYGWTCSGPGLVNRIVQFYRANDTTATGLVATDTTDANGRWDVNLPGTGNYRMYSVTDNLWLDRFSWLEQSAKHGTAIFSDTLFANGEIKASNLVTIEKGYNGIGSDAQLVIRDSRDVNKRLRVGYDTTGNRGFIQATHAGVANKPLLLNPNGGEVSIMGATSTANTFHVNPGNVDVDVIVGTSGEANTFRIDGGGNNIAVGAIPTARTRFLIEPIITPDVGAADIISTLWLERDVLPNVTGQTGNYTDVQIQGSFPQATGATTLPNATTLTIVGAPSPGNGNVSITKARSLWIKGGTSQFDDSLIVKSGVNGQTDSVLLLAAGDSVQVNNTRVSGGSLIQVSWRVPTGAAAPLGTLYVTNQAAGRFTIKSNTNETPIDIPVTYYITKF